MLNARKTFITYSALLLALAATSEALAASLTATPTLLAQAPTPTSFPVPSSIPSGSTLAVDGSSSMTLINEALKQRFEQKFAGTTVKLADAGTAAAIAALVKGDIDLAAISRPLTAAEKAEGLVAVPISREKIAIIIGTDNPYAEGLTFEQFAKIFRGEITNWAEVGGAPGKIRFVDRPDTSDTRLSLGTYKVFQGAPFETGSTATQMADDETATAVSALGQDGISYAIADQVLGQSTVKIVPMHKTLPDNPAYPYSQPRGYAYKAAADGTLSPIVQAFLGFATSAPGQEAIETAKAAEAAAVATATATASPISSPTPEPSPVAASPSPSPSAAVAPLPVPSAKPGIPWWGILLPLLGLAGLLLWLKGRGATPVAAPIAAPVAAAGIVPPLAAISDPRLILTPRNCRDAYAYWEIPEAVKDDFWQQGGRDLRLRLYDVTDIDLARQEPLSVQEFNCVSGEQDLHIPIALDNRDYLAELGYVAEDGRWMQVVRSTHVRVPACEPLGAGVAPGVASGVASSEAEADLGAEQPEQGTIGLPHLGLPQLGEIGAVGMGAVGAVVAGAAALPGAAFAAGKHDEVEPQPSIEADGGADSEADSEADGNGLLDVDAWEPSPPEVPTVLDVTAPDVIAPEVTPEVPTDLDITAPEAPELPDGEDDRAGIGAADLGMAGIGMAGVGMAGIGLAGIGAVLAGAAIAGAGDTEADRLDPQSSIVFSKWGTTAGHVKWELSEADKAALQDQGGRNLKLRIYDATALDLDTQAAHSVEEYGIHSWINDHDKIVPIHQGDRDYVAEVGYTTDDGRWLKLARSQHVHFASSAVAELEVQPDVQPDLEPVIHPAAVSGALFEGYPLTEHSVITDVVVHSRRNAFLLSAAEMQHIQDHVAAKTHLASGLYEIKITDGSFDYQAQTGEPGEPLAILWIYGGRVINKATNVPVMSTWSTLNGYGDILTLEVLDSTTFCAFFIDTYLDDNEGEVRVSVEKIYAEEILATQD